MLLAFLPLFTLIGFVDGFAVRETQAASLTVITTKVGNTVRLPCRTSFDEPVDWRYQKDATFVEDYVCTATEQGTTRCDQYSKWPRIRADVSTPGDYTLTIHNVAVNDGGMYHCIEEGGSGKRHTIQLSVLVHDSMRTVHTVAGEPIVLKCRARRPVDRAKLPNWRFIANGSSTEHDIVVNGTVFNGFRGAFVYSSADSGVYDLLIRSVRFADAGVYTCTENEGLGTSHTMSLHVHLNDKTIVWTPSPAAFGTTEIVNTTTSTDTNPALFWMIPLMMMMMMMMIVLVAGITLFSILRDKLKKQKNEVAQTGEDFESKFLIGHAVTEFWNGTRERLASGGKTSDTAEVTLKPSTCETPPPSPTAVSTDGRSVTIPQAVTADGGASPTSPTDVCVAARPRSLSC